MLEVNAIQNTTQNMVFGNKATKSKVARMRTVQQCLDYIRSLDSESCITDCFVRRLCRDRKINCFFSGIKILVDIDSFLDYLRCGAN